MIDAVRFSTSFTAFWNMSTPTCEHFVRKLNLGLYERFDTPMAVSDTKDRALVAEFGFFLFVAQRWPSTIISAVGDAETIAENAARKRIQALRGEEDIAGIVNFNQRAEASEIARRLSSFFNFKEKIAIPRPIFPGCGFIDHSEADVIFGSTLYEVKTVDRAFRSNDIRQLITYCALNALENKKNIKKIGVINPRRGVYFQLGLDFVSREISGKSMSALSEEIHQAISSGGISR